MKSSAMREMMALTEQPEVISLAGGLPDTSTFDPQLYAALMAQVADGSTARALQVQEMNPLSIPINQDMLGIQVRMVESGLVQARQGRSQP